MKKASHILIGVLLNTLFLFATNLHAQNVTLGPGAGASIVGGFQNTLIGEDAGNSITNSIDNTFLGFEAGLHNIVNGNTFLGTRAGKENTTGMYNTFIGINAGRENTDGYQNTFIGRSTGLTNTLGSKNTFMGELSGFNNKEGNENTFMGVRAGFANTDGSNNTFIGNRAGESNEKGSYNTFIGEQAGLNTNGGYNNTFVGVIAGENNTTGFENTALGSIAGKDNKTGFRNTYLGGWAGSTNVRGNRNTYLGYYAIGLEDNEQATALGSYSKANGSYSTAIGANAVVFGSNRLVLGGTQGYNESDGTFVGIGTVTPNYLLQLGQDDAAKPGSNVWTIASDQRLKKDIVPFTDGISVIQQINPVRFHYNGKAAMPTEKEYVGIIAQDMQQIAPYMVGEFVYEDTTGAQETYLDYDGNAMTYLLINSIKELNNSVEDLYILREELLAEVATLRAQFDSLADIVYFPGARQSTTSGLANIESVDTKSQPRLWQNMPNPANNITKIWYHVPVGTQQARIQLTTLQGVIVREWQILQPGRGEIKLQADELAAGIYTYQLLIDGNAVDSKKMILR